MSTQITLDIQTAINYAIAQMKTHGCNIAIVSAKPSTEYGIEVVDIIFNIIRGDGLADLPLKNHTFSVWLEDGAIHGEW